MLKIAKTVFNFDLKKTTICIVTHCCLIDIIYCQKDEGDEKFQDFCREFLAGLSIEQLKSEKTPVNGKQYPGYLFLVLILPSANRQNNLDVLSDSLTKIRNQFELKGNYK